MAWSWLLRLSGGDQDRNRKIRHGRPLGLQPGRRITVRTGWAASCVSQRDELRPADKLALRDFWWDCRSASTAGCSASAKPPACPPRT